MQTAVQLYTLRSLDAPLPEMVRRVAEAGFDGVEFAGIGGDESAVADALSDTGLAAPSAHVGIDALESDSRGVAETYDALGVDSLVVPYLDPDHFADEDAAEDTADRLGALAGTVPGLGYHNHEHEFVELDGEYALERVVTEADVELELDVGWAHAAGADPASLVDRHADRIEVLHLKDVVEDADAPRGGRPVDLGAGDVPLDAVLDAARDASVEWVVFEHDDPDDPLESLESADSWLAERGL
ncbi:sugar phosphate isomerase/epimerase family protein [Halopelagius longus]|uniref:Sugar phosphate isomerase/epimerase n=1 Tax=Halopelagius longus TaxID=1236180 RepID=A0A1H0Y8X5_9EURY|nr:sugar phosphate isomerase/epimerase [Halopelagius longus]RDI72347.1 sugar phosphate isomerase/epimerase [Halopelagius longus]SDQ11553.1 Sugar phosphate isomerase/epimerase [Halopelagius longus]